MKTFFFIVLFIISSFGFAQNNHIVKTDDGRRVLLKADFSWEYIDAQPKTNSPVAKKPFKKLSKNACNLNANFVEPKLNSKIQGQLRKGRVTMKHIKKRVAKDNKCSVDEVVLTYVSETRKSGVYEFCANGAKVKYKRFGNSVTKPLNIF